MKGGNVASRGGMMRALAVLGILALLAAPTLYLYHAWTQLSDGMQTSARQYAAFLEERLKAAGSGWQDQVATLGRDATILAGFEGRALVRDAQGRSLAVRGAAQSSPSFTVRTAFTLPSGEPAEVELRRGAQPVLWEILGVGSLALALGALIGLVTVQSLRRSRQQVTGADGGSSDGVSGLDAVVLTLRPETVRATGLLTRSAFAAQVRSALSESSGPSANCTVFHLDLDHFKSMNGMVGIAVADALLDQVAKAVQTRVASLTEEAGLSPAVISAPGGDVFLILVRDLPMAQNVVEAFARGVLESLSHVFEVGSRQLYISACIGISRQNGRELDAEVLMREAELAKCHAKRQGSGSYAIHDQEMEVIAQARDAMGYELRQALEQDEFQLYYQPKVHLVTGAVTGVEALLRWQPAGRQMVMPDQFVPVLEDTGLIVPAGAWVLRQACRQIMAWRERGMPPISIAVNVSARQLQQHGFVDTVEQVLAETGLEARYLELELTESIFIDNATDNVRVLSRLAALGVSLAIDDFGTGHSSLSYLRNFSPRTLKIDRSFLSDTSVDEADNIAIARAIIALGHGLGLHVVAEGVETEAQAEFLRGYGCDQMQGYLLSRPQSADMMEAWLWAHLKGRESLDSARRAVVS
ncbi:MAG: bifunctional diguanylate cyclase/phosphodiesterase [Lautropia sp.]|nr:bifunctional diguanylate cyclase/phosphodiesterase [Lautropia sp.]